MAKKPRKRFDTLGNLDMIKNSVTAIKHHADELTAELKKNPEIEAWVLAKVDRAAQNLSDVTHYLDGEMNKFADGGMMADGGMAKGGSIKLGDVVEVKEPNYGYNDSYYVVSNKAGYDKKSFLISPTRSTLSDVFHSYQLKKIMADGGKVGDSGTVEAANYNQYTGIIKEIKKSNLSVNLGNGIKGTESETYATIIDENGKERFGILI
jgi:hypothetical protein